MGKIHLCTAKCHQSRIIKLLNHCVIPFGFRKGKTEHSSYQFIAIYFYWGPGSGPRSGESTVCPTNKNVIDKEAEEGEAHCININANGTLEIFFSTYFCQ